MSIGRAALEAANLEGGTTKKKSEIESTSRWWAELGTYRGAERAAR